MTRELPAETVVADEELRLLLRGLHRRQSGLIRTVTHASTFKDFLLKEEIMRGINEAGFEKPSDVQQNGIYYVMHGEDLLAQAKSGTGKTAVFAIGILQNIKVGPEPFQCLVLSHTRELAVQIANEFQRLGKYIQGLRITTIIGGMDEEGQVLTLENNPPHIVIGTPGRVLKLTKEGKIKLDNLKYFVVDECDQVLQQIGLLTRHAKRCPGNLPEDQAKKASSHVYCHSQ